MAKETFNKENFIGPLEGTKSTRLITADDCEMTDHYWPIFSSENKLVSILDTSKSKTNMSKIPKIKPGEDAAAVNLIAKQRGPNEIIFIPTTTIHKGDLLKVDHLSLSKPRFMPTLKKYPGSSSDTEERIDDSTNVKSMMTRMKQHGESFVEKVKALFSGKKKQEVSSTTRKRVRV